VPGDTIHGGRCMCDSVCDVACAIPAGVGFVASVVSWHEDALDWWRAQGVLVEPRRRRHLRIAACAQRGRRLQKVRARCVEGVLHLRDGGGRACERAPAHGMLHVGEHTVEAGVGGAQRLRGRADTASLWGARYGMASRRDVVDREGLVVAHRVWTTGHGHDARQWHAFDELHWENVSLTTWVAS